MIDAVESWRRAACVARVLSPTAFGVIRMAAYLFVVLTAASALALALPTSRYLATAEYDLAPFDFEVNGPLTAENLTRLRAIGTVRPVIAVNGAALQNETRSSTGVLLYLLEEGDARDTWFSDATTASRAEVPRGCPPIDVSAAAARRLGVRPGDDVRARFLGGVQRACVRRVVVLARSGETNTAMMKVDSAIVERFVRFTSSQRPFVATAALVTGASRAEVEDALREPGLSKPVATVSSRAQLADDALRRFEFTTGAVVAVAVLGAGVLFGLAAREGARATQRRAQESGVLYALGASRGVLVAVSAVLMCALVLACGIASFAALQSFVMPSMRGGALPPPLRGPLSIGIVVASVGAAAAAAFGIVRRFSDDVDVLQHLSADAVR